jgi:ferredoxin-nitrate reductase
MWTMGLNQSSIGVNKNLSLINLNLITGHIGKPGSGPFSLTGQPNAMGGREVGGLSNLLPAHRNLANADHRAEVEKFWGGTTINPQPGLTATEMFEALNEGKLKAIWILCTNPVTSLPNARMVEEGLKKAKFVVVQEISNKPESLQYADVILPAAGWAEKEGTMTNSERRISYLNKVIDAPGEALPDAEIICRFAQKMGYKGFDFEGPADIYAEHARLTAKTNMDISGLNYEILKELKTVQWPYKKRGAAKGTTRLFTDNQFYTPSQKAVISPVADTLTSELPTTDFPFILTTGRIRDQWHTMSKTGKVNKLNQHIKEAFLEIHPDDALRLDLNEGDLAVITSRRGDVRVKAKISPEIKKGVVFLPMHWGKILANDLNRANNITSTRLDPLSKEPDFKYCAVNVVKYKKPAQRVVVVGAGAGAFGFVKSYRELNKDDEIIIFSKENYPFYNRVMLPDYISGEQKWEQLVKMTDEEEPEYNIKMYRGVTVDKIDRENKFVVDSRGIKTTYDILLLATGSRASVPKNVPALPGIFTMRNRNDADNFKKHINPNAHVVIVGGGLLGLEMAASLREIGIKITIVQRVSRFLNRQLDELGSRLLHEEMVDQGCDIYYDDEVQLFYGRSKLTGVGLKSGRKINCDAMILAIGTTPNLEIAKDSGLECKRGVIVNQRMQTSDPDVFAIGEIAEFEGTLYGITAAAEQQAEVMARYISGDIASYYKGSLFMNIIKIHGFDLCSIGLSESPDDVNYEEIVFIDKAKRYYKKCIIHQDRLVGTILVGDKGEFQEFRELIANKTELSEKRLSLLRSGKQAEPVLGKLVCSCNNVGADNIRKKVAEGCNTLNDVCSATGAGTGCGSCKPEVKRLMHEALEKLTRVTI